MAKGTLIVVGLIAGGALGWFTAPRPAVDIYVGGLNVQVDGTGGGGTMTASDRDGAMRVEIGKPGGVLVDPATRALIFAAAGGIVGLGLGFLTDRRKRA